MRKKQTASQSTCDALDILNVLKCMKKKLNKLYDVILLGVDWFLICLFLRHLNLRGNGFSHQRKISNIDGVYLFQDARVYRKQ